MVGIVKSSSAKQKGRAYQQEVIKLICSIFETLELDDLISRSSGSNGEDIIMSPHARRTVGDFSIECKHHAKGLTLAYDALEQAKAQKKGIALACLRNNHKRSIIAMYAEDFFALLRGLKDGKD